MDSTQYQWLNKEINRSKRKKNVTENYVLKIVFILEIENTS